MAYKHFSLNSETKLPRKTSTSQQKNSFLKRALSRHFARLQPAAKRATFEARHTNCFGEGARRADVLFVGEEPGNEEDLTGRPFVGPAGRLLNEALEEAGIDRSQTYVTNVVKHFKWNPRGKRRIHKKPNAGKSQRADPGWKPRLP